MPTAAGVYLPEGHRFSHLPIFSASHLPSFSVGFGEFLGLPFAGFFDIIDSQKINGFTGIITEEHFNNSYKIIHN
jgi:hypothetical protein